MMNDKKKVFSIPFAGKTYYKSEYPNWGTNASVIWQPMKAKTVIEELPFYSGSTYSENFSSPAKKNEKIQAPNPFVHTVKPFKPAENKSPLNVGIPFLGTSISSSTY